MFLALVVALGGAAIVAIAFVNRNRFDERPLWRRMVPFAVGAVIVVALAGGAFVAADSNSQHGVPGVNAGTAPSPP